MRRVIDDSMLKKISAHIDAIIWSLDPEDFTEYHWGIDRVQVGLIRDEIVRYTPHIKLGKNTHANGIGNNNAYEIIYTGNPQEEQICGLLHLTDDMYGGVYVWVSDIDNTTKTETRHMR